MIHYCEDEGFTCSQTFHSDKLILEAGLSLSLSHHAKWTGEVYVEVLYCPFCGYKTNNPPLKIDHATGENKDYEKYMKENRILRNALEKNSENLP